MAKPLSQEEIDILLNGGEGGEEERHAQGAGTSGKRQASGAASQGERIQPYNFKRPRLFSQAQMRVLNYVHESFARDLSVYLSAQLRTIVDISLTAVDQVMYSEFVMSSAPPSALYVLEERKLDHRCVFEIDPRLVIYTIEKLFGGSGELLERAREISPIEQRVMSRVMQRAFREMEKAWEQVHDMSVEEVAFEANAEFVQIIPAAEPAIVASFEVRIYDQPSFINICYPYLLLEKMLGRAGMEQWISSSTTPASAKVRKRYEEALRKTDVTMSAELGRAVLPITELMQLQEGDVIPLNSATTDPVRVYINNNLKFEAAAGRSGRHRALRINRVELPKPGSDLSLLTLDDSDDDEEDALDARADGAGSAAHAPEDAGRDRAPA